MTEDKAVKFTHVPDGVYEKGRARINKQEARALVNDLMALFKSQAFIEQKLSIGVVTFNAEQQKLIEDLLDDERRRAPSLDVYFSDEHFEPVFVKNLENVQGDERDVMFFSLGYGPAYVGGPISMNFGPMNRAGGHRRLNVAITRARQELRVFASFTPDQIDVSRTQAEGVRDLKHFLEFAERGPRALAEADAGSLGGYESPFEESVAGALRRRGWILRSQVGVSAFRIDLGVVDPDRPGRYLAGIECDGATYHRSATARDRDKLREQVLRGLGWEIVRIWSTDWWIDEGTAIARVDSKLRRILDAVRGQRRAEEEVRVAAVSIDAGLPALTGVDAEEEIEREASERRSAGVFRQHGDKKDERRLEDESRVAAGLGSAPVYARAPDRTPPAERRSDVYREADLGELADPAPFFESSYDAALVRMVTAVVEAEAPIRDDVLCRRIARQHGCQRTGAKIAERVMRVAKTLYEPVKDSDGRYFFWPTTSAPGTWMQFRRPDGEVRPMDEVCLPELRALAVEALKLAGPEADPIATMAKIAGFGRLGAASRQRLEAALSLVLEESATR